MPVVKTRYATTNDGAHLAYHVRGAGDIDVLFPSYGFISVAAFDEEPHIASFLERLGSFARIICFDWRGIGLSDPFDPANPPSLELQAHDVLAVMDDVGSNRAAFFASLLAGPIALLMGATHPDRIAALVLVNTTARVVEADDYEFGVPVDVARRFADEVIEPAAEADAASVVAVHAPSVAGDDRFVAWWEDAGRRGASPAIARALQLTLFDVDVRDLLPSIHIPTLVLQRRETQWFRPGHGGYLAEHIPGAQLVELAGADMPPFTGNAEVILEEVEEFLTGSRHLHDDAERILATVLFTDIVGSTVRAATTGDRQWLDTLDRYEEVVAREVTRHRGRHVKSTGDGTLATFDSPARAIRCACAVRDALAPLGLQVRSGLHTGEVDVRGADIGGIAVHIAARVMALAGSGDVLVSGAVPPLLIGSGIDFEARGEHELKDVPGAWQIHAVAAAS